MLNPNGKYCRDISEAEDTREAHYNIEFSHYCAKRCIFSATCMPTHDPPHDLSREPLAESELDSHSAKEPIRNHYRLLEYKARLD